MKDIVPLREIVFDIRASDGTFCAHPYADHPKGCPNYPQCPDDEDRFTMQELQSLEHDYDWFGVIEEFDLKTHAQKLKQKHLDWSERQCRCLLYWQGGVRKRLLSKAMSFQFEANCSSILLSIPEASGINVFATMEKAGIIIEKHPDTVRKVMLVLLHNKLKGAKPT